jgi:hypothetical protein
MLNSRVRSEGSGPDDRREAAPRGFKANPQGAAGNGSLMRTAPDAVAALADDERLVELAMRIAAPPRAWTRSLTRYRMLTPATS